MTDYKQLFEATFRQDWAAVIADVKSRPGYLEDEMLLRHLLLAMVKTGGPEVFPSFNQSADGVLLGDAYADAAYLFTFSFLFPEAMQREIRKLNDAIVDDAEMGKIISRLLCEDGALGKYLEARADLFRVRYAKEYRHLLRLKNFELFPYKYLVDYAGRNHVPGAERETPLSVDFIYCIKNRVERTTLSLRSLDEAYTNYLRNGGRALTVTATVSEDTSPDMLDVSNVRRATLPVVHHLLDTGIGWTRSGLLNYGVKRSEADLLAFVDADFLFHEGFLSGFERALRRIDLEKNAIAVNLVETEAHNKDGKIYSRSSPYSYMWMAPRRTVMDVAGFDEGYSGHGFEDRDFEMKLTRAGGLTICDTASIDPECFVLHLSHVVRTGDERRKLNRDRFLKRSKLPDAKDILQEKWGEFPELHSKKYAPGGADAVSAGGLVDFLFFPHNQYHGLTFLKLREALRAHGYSAALVNISPPHPNEGAMISGRGDAYVAMSDVMAGRVKGRAMACMNDWEGKVVRRLIDAANAHNVPTIGIVEGVNDFHDVDTGFNRTAYTRVRHLLLNGDFDRKYFEGGKQDIRVAGIQRIDPLHPGVRKPGAGGRPKALVNVNFSYGVLKEHREQWLKDIAQACEKCGYEMITSQHRADDADLSDFNRSDRPLYDLLAECDVFISRFSGAILEALAMGANVVYYNSGFEKIDKFMEPLGAYVWAKDRGKLEEAMQFYAEGGKMDSASFMAAHCGIETSAQAAGQNSRTSIEKTTDALIDIVDARPFSSVQHTAFTRELGKKLIGKGGFAPSPSDSEIARLLDETTFGIKSFGRSRHLTKLVESILKRYPSANIMICDDSEEGPGKLPKGVKLVRPGAVDIGLSAGRNILLDQCETKYFVLLDDDFIFTDKTEIFALVGALDLYDIDIAGGVVYDVGPSAQKKDQPRTFYGCIDVSSGDGRLTISTGRVREWRNNLPLYDLVLNFFACRTESVNKVRWTEELKLGEHLDFFLRAREAGLKISYFPEVVVDHYRDHSANTEEYKAYRRRADEFHGRFKRMYSISKIYLNDSEIPG